MFTLTATNASAPDFRAAVMGARDHQEATS